MLLIAISIGSTKLSAENYALQFSANTNLVTIGKPDYTGANWTVELWAKRTGATTHATFLAGTAYKLNLETWNNTHFVGYSKTGGSNFNFAYTLPLNTWTHVAYVYGGGALSLYINGVLSGTAQTVATMALPLSTIGLSPESFVGVMDEIRIWKTTRTAAQLLANMNQSVNPLTETNLLAYWYFDDQATNITDLSTNGAVGKITGATYVKNTNATFVTTLPTMEVLKVSCSQNNEFYTTPGSKNQDLLCIKVQTQGVANPIVLNEVNINTINTSDLTDLDNISVYYTKTSADFATTDIVQAKLTPNTLKFQKDITLLPGTNYFWVAVDVKSTASTGHILDAGLQNVVLNGQTYTPDVQNPSGRRLINNPVQAGTMPYVSIIPAPNSYVAGIGSFTINADTKIMVSPEIQNEGEFLSLFLKNATGYTLPVTSLTGAAIANSIVLRINSASTLGNEGYKLVSNPDSIVISGKQGVGIFWGMQTLRQLLPVKIESKTVVANTPWTVPSATISDAPRFEYRGVMLDPSRHFFSVEFTKKYIDLLSLYKINNFHWHLTDDQGWRIEIKRYPKLQSIGAWRSCGTGIWGSPDGSKYGGYYTQEEIKEVVAYATERHVNIIPEIEIPGHSLGIISAYPELACTSGSGSYNLMCSGGISTDIICGGNDTTIDVYKHIFDEVMALFPYKYVHIGGDEAPKTRWQTCTKCQAKIAALGFTGTTKEEQLQRYIIDAIGSYLMSKGKEYIGWSEISNSGTIPTGAILQDWIGGADLAVQTGHKVIRSSYSGAMYISQRQSGDATEPAGPGNITTLDQTYAYEPIPSSYSTAQAKLVLGPEACLWTEWVVDGNHVEYMTSPRMQATAEIGWTQKAQKNLSTFKKNMLPQYVRLSEMDQNYRRVETSATTNVLIKKTITQPTVISSTLEGVSFFWNDANFSTTKSITVSETGIYKCYVDYFGVQSVVIYEITNTTAGVKNPASNNVDIQLYPNPATESVTVSLEMKKGNGGTIKLLSSQGNLVIEQIFEGNKLDKKISVSNLSKGLYLIQVRTNEGESTQKLIIE